MNSWFVYDLKWITTIVICYKISLLSASLLTIVSKNVIRNKPYASIYSTNDADGLYVAGWLQGISSIGKVKRLHFYLVVNTNLREKLSNCSQLNGSHLFVNKVWRRIYLNDNLHAFRDVVLSNGHAHFWPQQNNTHVRCICPSHPWSVTRDSPEHVMWALTLRFTLSWTKCGASLYQYLLYMCSETWFVSGNMMMTLKIMTFAGCWHVLDHLPSG